MTIKLVHSDDEAQADRRRAARKRTLKQGQIIFRDGQCVLDCAVLDISETGAKLKPSDVLLCPAEFLLRVKFGPTRACEVVWQSGGVLGVAFAD